MTAEDKKWIEGKLNGDRVLASAVEGYIKAAEGFLETSDHNPAYQTNNFYSGQVMSYNFKNVEKQLEGKIEFKALSEASWGSSSNPTTGRHDGPSPYRGYRSLEMLATQLTANPLR